MVLLLSQVLVNGGRPIRRVLGLADRGAALPPLWSSVLSGKKGVAPCLHPGTHVTANYVTCDLGCDSSDGVPETIVDEDTKPLCKNCGSDNVQVYPEMYYNGKSLWHCHACYRSFPGE